MSKKFFFCGGLPIPEPETIAYLNAAGIVNDGTLYNSSTAFEIGGNVIWISINKFFVGLKNVYGLTLGVNNLSTIFDALYIALANSASYCKWNTINPSDTDVAHRLVFSGGWTYSGASMKGNGSNGYANTFWNSNAKAGTKRVAYGGYRRTMGAGGLSGSWNLTNDSRLYQFGLSDVFTVGSQSNPGNSFAGFSMASLTSANLNIYDKDGLEDTYSSPTLTLVNENFYLGARNNGISINNYNDVEYSIYFLTGKVEINQAQAEAMIPVFNQLMIDLNRNV